MKPNASMAAVFAGLALLNSASASESVPITLDLSTAHRMTAEGTSDGLYSITTTGGNSKIEAIDLKQEFDPSKLSVFSFEYFCPDGADDFTVRFGPPIEASKSASLGSLPKAETWVETSIDLNAKSAGKWSGKIRSFQVHLKSEPGVRIQLRNIHLRAANADESKGADLVDSDRDDKAARAGKLNDYFATDFPAKIESVGVFANDVQIAGTIPDDASDLLLAEIRMHEEPWALKEFTRLSPLSNILNGRFGNIGPRFDGDYDSLLSRWALVRLQPDGSHQLASHAAFGTDLTTLTDDEIIRPSLGSKKGMGGVKFNEIVSELVELGVEHITVNASIHAVVRLKPSENTVPHEWDGETYFMNLKEIEGLDKMIKFATDNEMITSMIILAGFPGDPELRDLLIHPESTKPGTYGMPNLTSPEGVRIYAATLDFLAQRYSSKDGPHGLVSNWIMHNEVDYAWTWSNMGNQPMELFMDTHIRSMRMAYLIARKHYPWARVFLSLTHSWNKPGPEGRSYSPRAMVDRLAESSRKEGDFEWGLACHPYPQSLFKADTWNDKLATFSFDTPMITPKNIEVLDAYLKQPSLLYLGSILRAVLLSEQGYHSDGYSEEAQQLQAAAFVYTWHKIRPLRSIEAFHNHRWIDHPQEGGLKLGLRTLPDEENPYGRKKLSWEIFKVLETEEETGATEFAKPIIGVEDSSEIPHKGKIK
jgi:hypothetical protein